MEMRNLGSTTVPMPIAGIDTAQTLDERIDPALQRVVRSARESLQARHRRQRAEDAGALIQLWKSEGVYPFEGIAEDAIEVARRERFDICALGIHEHLEVFRSGSQQDRRFTLGMLKATLEDSPSTLRYLLTEVLRLPADKAEELQGLLELTSLTSVIECSTMVTERLRFLTGLEELLFDIGSKRSFKERGELHRMLANETWVFGEEFRLTSDGESLSTVLRKHVKKLDMGKGWYQQTVVRDDGRKGFIDFVLGREIPSYASASREFLVVELKRPMKKIDLAAKAQIESYAMAVASDERFDTRHTHWTFLAVSNELTPAAARTLRHPTGAFGCFHEDPTLRIGLATWAGILNASRVRLEAFRAKLNHTVTRDEGLAWLRHRYAEYLPETFWAALNTPSN
ncbi:hypothetical protein D9X30_4546 [Cupriavidus sp. U2]|uniref:hypothetical protein n=1 Tax=Cupriavidus sp. U2 TaxID=2920269 RepID=UPI00129DA764|nr:hypothetical protein [Cupriavidus sp. U2]KAI3591061.1 hypothetical protein D9X30_4546 [Cupriavidus sp. U2]